MSLDVFPYNADSFLRGYSGLIYCLKESINLSYLVFMEQMISS